MGDQILLKIINLVGSGGNCSKNVTQILLFTIRYIFNFVAHNHALQKSLVSGFDQVLQMYDLKDRASHIWNADETGVSLYPKTGKVIALEHS